jgi:hypothetical protein
LNFLLVCQATPLAAGVVHEHHFLHQLVALASEMGPSHLRFQQGLAGTIQLVEIQTIDLQEEGLVLQQGLVLLYQIQRRRRVRSLAINLAAASRFLWARSAAQEQVDQPVVIR